MQLENQKTGRLFGDLFRYLRQQRGYKGDEGAVRFAKVMGVNRSTIYSWEKMDLPSARINLAKLARVLDVEEDRLRYPYLNYEQQMQMRYKKAAPPASLNPPDHLENVPTQLSPQAEELRKDCLEHIDRFIYEAASGDESRLHWTLIELRDKFPLTKWAE